MNNPTGGKRSAHRFIWVLGLVVLFAVLAFMFARPLAEPASDLATKPTPQSTEWAKEPRGPAVPVDLPTTAMTNVPDNERDSARENENAEQ